MEISSTSNTSYSRTVTPANSSSDRRASDKAETAIAESKPQERAQQQRAVQERLQQRNEETQRRLDGRLISFGHEQGNVSSEQKQTSYNRSRVNDAYQPAREEMSQRQNQSSHPAQKNRNEAIDIVI